MTGWWSLSLPKGGLVVPELAEGWVGGLVVPELAEGWVGGLVCRYK